MKNKRGQTTIMMLILILGLFITLVMLFVGGVMAVRVNNILDQNIQIGQVNLQTVNADTFGKFATMYLNSAEWWGLSAIMGMIMGLFISAYFTRGRFPKWGIILDIFIIIVMFFVAQYFAATYNTLLNSLTGAGETFLETYTPKTSSFMINLHIYTVIVGVIMMILFHAGIPKKEEERVYQQTYPGL